MSGLLALVTPWAVIEGILTKYGVIDPQPVWTQQLVAGICILLVVVGILVYLWERKSGLTHADSSLEAARQLIVKYLARSYSSLFNACNWTIRTDYLSDWPGEQRFERRVYFISEAMKDLQKLREKLTTDRSVPDVDLSAKLTLFLEHAESVIKKLRFFKRTYTQSGMEQQLVGYSPVPDLFAIQEIVDSLKHRYPDAFLGEGVVFSGILTPEKLEEVWENAAKERGLCLDANKFEKIAGRHVVIFDKTVFSKLYGMEDGEHVTLWGENEPLS